MKQGNVELEMFSVRQKMIQLYMELERERNRNENDEEISERHSTCLRAACQVVHSKDTRPTHIHGVDLLGS